MSFGGTLLLDSPSIVEIPWIKMTPPSAKLALVGDDGFLLEEDIVRLSGPSGPLVNRPRPGIITV